MTEAAEPRRIRFGRRSTRGVLLGLSRARVVAVVLAFGVVLAAVYLRGFRGVTVTAPVWGLLVAAAFVPVAGRPVADWLPVTGHWLWRRVRGQNVYGVRPLAPRPAGTLALPGDGAPVRVHEDPISGAAMLHDPHAHRLTAALRVAHPAFIMLGDAEQSNRVDGWGRVLARLCQAGLVARVQVMERAIPDSGHGVSSWWSEHGRDDDSWAARSYAELVRDAGPAGERHDTILAVSLDMHRAARDIRREGGGLRGAAAVLRGQMRGFEEAVTGAGLASSGWLDAAELAVLIRAAYDPGASSGLDRLGHGRDLGTAGPMGVVEEWDHLRSDGAWHAVLWISEWPRAEVYPTFLHPLVVGLSGVRRTVSLVAQPLGTREALRDIRRERVEHQTDEAQRQKLGQISDFGKLQEWHDTEQREAELVAGHGDLRFTGFVAVSAATLDELHAHVARVELAASQCGCETRLLYGQQSQAFLAAALPLARGLGRR